MKPKHQTHKGEFNFDDNKVPRCGNCGSTNIARRPRAREWECIPCGTPHTFIPDHKKENVGVKHDQDKSRIDLLDPNFIHDLAVVGTFGASKYGDYNWQHGIKFSRQYAAAQRHMLSFWGGENSDPETNQSHLLHAAYNMMMLYWHTQNKPELDDRPERVGVKND